MKTAIDPDTLLVGLPIETGQTSFGCARLLIGGDLCLVGKPESYLLAGRGAELWGVLPAIASEHNFFIANLECPLTRSIEAIKKSGPHLSADPKCAESIRSACINALALANNHIMDRGPDGLRDTLAACEGAGLATVGAGMDLSRAGEPLLVKFPGLKIAVIAISENEFSTARDGGPGANGLDLAANYLQIQKAKAAGDFVLLLFHSGHEYYPLPSPRMVQQCRFFAEAGAHAIVCCHAHVPGGLEIYKGVPIVYSTGNFLFDWPSQKPNEWHQGYLASLVADKGRTISIKLIPFEQCIGNVGFKFLSEPEASDFLAEVARLSEIISDPNKLQGKWLALVDKLRRDYISSVLSLNRVERRLYRYGLWPFWRTRRYDLPRLLNHFTCEAHRDLTIDALRQEIAKG